MSMTYEIAEGLPNGFATPGQHLIFDPRGSYPEECVLIKHFKEDNTVLVLDSDLTTKSVLEVSEYGAVKVLSKRTKLANFLRSDDWHFTIFRDGRTWRLFAGCHELAAPTLKQLREQINDLWNDEHNTEWIDRGSYSYKERVKLNRETRRKVGKAIAQLEDAKPAKKRKRKA